jgi:hypothetical protein
MLFVCLPVNQFVRKYWYNYSNTNEKFELPEFCVSAGSSESLSSFSEGVIVQYLSRFLVVCVQRVSVLYVRVHAIFSCACM